MSENLLKTLEDNIRLTLTTAKTSPSVTTFVLCFLEMESAIREMKEFKPKEQYPFPEVAATNEIGALYNFRIIILGD